MESNTNRKRSVLVYKRRTSICLEDSFWYSLHAIVEIENTTVSDFVEKVAAQRNSLNLSSSLRIAVLEYFQNLAVSSIAVRADLDSAIPGQSADTNSHENAHERDLDYLTRFWRRIKRRRRTAAMPGLKSNSVVATSITAAESLVAREGLEPPTPGL